MMKDKASLQKKTGRRLPLVAWLGYLLVVTFVVTGVTFSGYVTRTAGEDSARVAKFEVDENFTGEYTAELTGMYPGVDVEKPMAFTVHNKSEVTVDCYMILETTGNLPVEYYVEHADESISIPLGEKTFFATLQPGQATATQFTLQPYWPNEADSVWDAETYMYLADVITFQLITEQVD